MIIFEPFTPEEANILLAGLQELPAKVSLALIIKLKNQGDKQMEALSQAKAIEDKAKDLENQIKAPDKMDPPSSMN